MPAVTTLTGNRIYADRLPDGTTQPAVVYQIISTTPYTSLNADTGKLDSLVQFNLFTDSKADSIALTSAMQTALQRFQGAADDMNLIDVKLINIFDLDFDIETSETVRVVEFKFIYE